MANEETMQRIRQSIEVARQTAQIRTSALASFEPAAESGSMSGSADRERLAKLEGSYDALKVVRPMTLTVGAVILAAIGLGFTVVIAQLNSTNTRIDRMEAQLAGIPAVLREEFRAMRADMAAQTSAIANSVTAARQVQPQIILMAPPSSTQAPPQ